MRIYKTEEFMTHSKNLHIFKCTSDKAETLHTHEFIELVYVLSGSMTQIMDNRQYEVRHGDILFMNYGCTHAFSAENRCSYVNILFSPELMGEEIVTPANAFCLLSLAAFNEMRSDANFGKLTFFGSERKEIEDIILAMLKEYKEKQSAWETVVGNYLNTLIVKMLRKTQMGMEQVEIDGMWQELSEYIDQNLDSRLTLSSLAQKCFYNPSYFSRVFKEKFGVSLTEYITRKRLNYAIELLSGTDLSLDEISSRAGFSDRNSFYHAFSHYLNSTPTTYRKK
ncbi:MAG: AraC family transcriptional regulator [Clostridia bacterium]|nr:AraC family transcriptional regulator [Clostridia bacterium]